MNPLLIAARNAQCTSWRLGSPLVSRIARPSVRGDFTARVNGAPEASRALLVQHHAVARDAAIRGFSNVANGASSIPAGPSAFRRGLRFVGKALKYLFGVSVAAAGVTIAYQTYQDSTFPRRLHRLGKIYTAFVPIYFDYATIPYRYNEPEHNAAYERLHEKYAPKVYELALELRGAWVKLCQAVASRPEMAPEAYRKALTPLMDSVPPLSFEELEEGAKKEFGISDLAELFESLDRTCLGAASVSQVHGAILKEPVEVFDYPGAKPRLVKDVVLKIRYPDAPHNFGLDFATMKQLISLARPEIMPAMQEAEKMIKRELDFREEADSLTEIGDAVRATKRFPKVRIPHPIPGMCTEGAIVMERMEGSKLETRVKHHLDALAQGMGTTVDELKQRFQSGMFGRRGGPSPAGETSPPVGIWGITKFVFSVVGVRDVLKFAVSYVSLLAYESFGWWLIPTVKNTFARFGVGSTVPMPEPPLPVRTGPLYESVLAVHGFEILELGRWNCDPHPGNIFLDSTGTISLLDYGATSRLPDSQRFALARLILELSAQDPDRKRVAAEMGNLGFAFSFPDDPEGAKSENLLNIIAMSLFTSRLPARRHGHRGKGEGARPMLDSVPDRFFLIARTVGLLRGLGMSLGTFTDVSKAWAGSARRALEAAGQPV